MVVEPLVVAVQDTTRGAGRVTPGGRSPGGTATGNQTVTTTGGGKTAGAMTGGTRGAMTTRGEAPVPLHPVAVEVTLTIDQPLYTRTPPAGYLAGLANSPGNPRN